MKPKLFLNSTDVADITGYTQRNARNIMSHIRVVLDLGKTQAITIYDFANVFNVPAETLFLYINSKKIKTLAFTQNDLSSIEAKDLKPMESHLRFLDSEEFVGIVNTPRPLKSDAKTCEACGGSNK